MSRFATLSLFVLFLSIATSSALFADPPGRVARVSYLSGQVSFRPAGVDEWTEARINRVLIPGDELWADSGSRIELHLGSAAIRADESTDVGLMAADDQIAQLRLSEGTINVRLRRLDEDQTFEIDTPAASISLLRAGSYRIYVTPDGNRAEVSVRSGEAEATVSDGGFPIRPAQMAIIEGSGDSQTHEIAEIGNPDDFDGWSRQRDARDDRAVAANNVSSEMVGYEDLEDNGRWEDVAGYGRVWSPTNVDAGWAPYRDGHWAWINPWGWTWVDDASWGFAPYHYGRWANAGGRWFWAPGQTSVSIQPVFAPALVVFAGGPQLPGGHGVAWFPLAPGEVYIPSYHVASTYVQRVNAPSVRGGNIDPTRINVATMTYENLRVNGAITAVSTDTFQNSKPVSRAFVPIQSAVATRLVVAGTSARIAPLPASVLVPPAATARAIARPSIQVLTRPVRALIAPPPAPIPFALQRRALEAHPGQPLNAQEIQTIPVSVPRIEGPVVRPALTKGFVTPARANHPVNNPVVGNVSSPGPAQNDHPVIRPAPVATPGIQQAPVNIAPNQPVPVNHSVPINKPVNPEPAVSTPSNHPAPVRNPGHYATPIPNPANHPTPAGTAENQQAPVNNNTSTQGTRKGLSQPELPRTAPASTTTRTTSTTSTTTTVASPPRPRPIGPPPNAPVKNTNQKQGSENKTVASPNKPAVVHPPSPPTKIQPSNQVKQPDKKTVPTTTDQPAKKDEKKPKDKKDKNDTTTNPNGR